MPECCGHILLIDDESLNVKLLKHMLESKGFQTSTAFSGQDALHMLETTCPDLILLDVLMPGIGGYEVCQKIKTMPKFTNTPVIFLTALTDSEDIVKGFSVGAVDYVRKPFNVPELLARVNTHLEIKRDREIIQQQKIKLEQINEELEKMNQSLYQRSITDSLTNLFNRQYILDQFRKEIDRFKRYGSFFSMMLLDIDHFKKVNDTFGHIEGDAALVRCSNAIKQSLRAVDVLGRYGGEEFLAILPFTQLSGALTLAKRVSQAMHETGNPDSSVPALTISIGVAQFMGEDEKTFIHKIDTLLYKAKTLGRNRIECGE